MTSRSFMALIIGILIGFAAIVSSAGCRNDAAPAASVAPEEASNKAFAQASCSIRPDGVIGDRWTVLGGADGPLGCPTSAVQPSPDGNGQVMNFEHGQMVTSPAQGTNMTVAAYQQLSPNGRDADLIVDWGDTFPFSYDKFIVRWDKGGVNVGQRDVPNQFRTRGVWIVPQPTPGQYSIKLEGCDNGTFGSSCNQGFTVPVVVTYAPPVMPPSSCALDAQVTGPVRDRWWAIGGADGPLGCPTQGNGEVFGRAGSRATFDNGQVAWSTDQGTNFTVAAYRAESNIVVEWANTAPFHYDFFIVRWDKDGVNVGQVDVGKLIVNGNLTFPGPHDHGVQFIPANGSGTYTVTVEGCDQGTFTATCNQGFSIPVNVNLAAATTDSTSCALGSTVTGAIRDRWAALQGPGGLLGCPTGAAAAVPGRNGMSQNFEHGQIVSSPDQGTNMAVAVTQAGTNLVVAWGDTSSFFYDKFIVRWDKDGTNIGQQDVFGASSTSGIFDIATSGNGQYSIVVEGCDDGLFGSTCNQGFTVPVVVNYPIQGAAEPAPTEGFAIDVSSVTPGTTVANGRTAGEAIANIVDSFTACRKALGHVFQDEFDFMDGAIAKLDELSRKNTGCKTRPRGYRAEVNEALRVETVQSKVGTTITVAGQTLRTGEYDVALTGYTTLLYRFGRFLDGDVQSHVLHDLLNQRGPLDDSQFSSNIDFPLVGFIDVPETENHLNMIETARYLTNQLLYAETGDSTYDNEANGMNYFMLNRLQSFLKNDFLEYNSKPYQSFTDDAIQNLYDFSKDRRVKLGARLVLDYISAKYAVSSNFNRRNAPYQRRVSHYSPALLDEKADAQNARFTMMTGMTQLFNELAAPDTGHMNVGYSSDIVRLHASTYRAPDVVLDLIMNQDRRKFYQRFSHRGLEVYSSERDFLITAGGFWNPSPYDVAGFTLDDDAAPAVPTTLMPTGHDAFAYDMIQIAGFNALDLGEHERMNTCVAPGFACGLNPIVPQHYLIQRDAQNQPCTVLSGPWTFIDASRPGCGTTDYGFLVAVYEAQDQVSGNWFGFFEAHPRDPNMSFDAFRTEVLASNGSRTFSVNATNLYTMSSGAAVQFTIAMPGANKHMWPVVSTGVDTLDRLGTDSTTWPLARGDVLNSQGHAGVLTFDNTGLGQRLILDFSDFGEPRRISIGAPVTVPQPCGSLVPGEMLNAYPTAGFYKPSCDNRFTLQLQGDGNLVLYEGPTALWASNTAGSGASQLVMQQDGNLVLYSPSGAVWATNTGGNPGASFAIQDDGNLVVYTALGVPIWASMQPAQSTECGVLRAGQGLAQGTTLTSCDGRFVMSMQLDGNLVLSQQGVGPFWASDTAGQGNLIEAVMQDDGNFVLYNRAFNPPRAIWSSGTAGHSGAFTVLQNDGNLVIYDANGAVPWASNTCCR